MKKCKKVTARPGFELATFGSTQKLNSQNPLSHGVKKIIVSLVEMNNNRFFHIAVFLKIFYKITFLGVKNHEEHESGVKKIRSLVKTS